MITNGEEWYYIALKSVHTDDGFNRPIILNELIMKNDENILKIGKPARQNNFFLM